MLHYILQVIFFQLSFLLVYELLLKKETFFSYNRWYLLLTPVISFLLPFLQFQGLSELVPAENLTFLPEVYVGQGPVAVENAEMAEVNRNGFQVNWWWLFYSVGAALSLFLFLRKAFHLNQLFHGRLLSEANNVRIIQIPDTKIACTFFNTVFIGSLLTEAEKQHILSHEIVHVRQKHSIDLLYFELLKIVCWFNPLVYIFQSRIAGVHEYIADSQVVKFTEKRSYYQQLLNTAFNTENISFINQFFNHSLIKKRIVMLQKSKSKAVAKIKYLVLVPLLGGMLTYVSCSKESYDDTLNTEETTTTIEVVKDSEKSSETIGDVPFVIIENVPVFPGCEELSNNFERKTCMSEKINAYINENFNTDLGKELGLQGVNRIYVQFRINKDGNIEVMGIRAPHPALEEEANRLVTNLPKMQPGKQRGETVAVIYSLPIVFNSPGDGTSNEEQAQQKSTSPVDPTGDIPFAVIDEAPVSPGCEGLESKAERKACTSQKVSAHVSENFNYKLAKDLGVERPTRVYVQFRISETGKVAVLGVRAPHPQLEEEARRVVGELPDMVPGKQEGQPRGVLYSLPISLNTNE